MPARATRIILISLVTSALTVVGALAASPSGKSSKKKVLVELYTSQGCNSCPAAEALVGRLGTLGVPSDQLVVVAFHVDYFNTPWKDPFSTKLFSQREFEYSLIYQRENKIESASYLYFTPMMMVDGRYPLLGSDQPKAQRSLKTALAANPEASLEAKWVREPGESRKGRLAVKVSPIAATASGRDLLVGVAVVESPVSTKVASGENGGKTLVEHNVARSFAHEKVNLGQGKSKTLNFPLELAAGAQPKQTHIAIFVQDWKEGRVFQAESLDW